MYYTHLLKHSNDKRNTLENAPIEVSQFLEKIVPSFFNRKDGDGYVHVLIICSDSKDPNWNVEEFKDKFCTIDNPLIKLLFAAWKRDKRSKRLCVHIDKNLQAIPDAVKEVLQAVTTCYGEENITGDLLGNLIEIFEIHDARAASSCQKILMSEIDKAIKTVGCRRTLFVRIILPKKCFKEFENLSVPPFIEYVVLGQLQDPKIQKLEDEIRYLKDEIKKKDNEIERKEQQMNKLDLKVNQLRSAFIRKNTYPALEVEKIITAYENRISKLTEENQKLLEKIEKLNVRLTEISAILDTERTKQKIK